MMEKLKCTQCDDIWERPKTRGRKPVVCPECAEFLIEQESKEKAPKAEKPASTPRQYAFYIPGPSNWECTECGETLTAFVGVTGVPLHNCKPRRNQISPMVQVIKKRSSKKVLIEA